MGNVSAKQLTKTVSNNPTESAFAAWMVISLVNHARNAAKVDASKRDGSAPAEVVAVRATKDKKLVFTQTSGGEVDMGWTGALEFFLGAAVRCGQTALMVKMGSKYFDSGKAGDLTEFHRLRNIIWAAFALLPLFDLAVADWTNPKKEDQAKHFDVKFRLPLYMFTAAGLASTWKGIQVLCDKSVKLGTRERLAILASMSFFNGALGITIAHELGHKQWWFEKMCAYALLTNVNYNHWMEEHVTGHHKNVATPNDPASSRYNESLYAFLPRTFVGSWLSAWQIEMERIKENGLSKVFNNRMIAHALLPLAWAGFIAKTTGGGAQAFKLFYAQAFGSALLLEIVNYVEHYGLEREKLADGTYARPDPSHSWNSPHRLSNSFLFKLQRHSDHHTFAMRPYNLLRNFEESPQLPSGYPGMITLALFPPLYRWVMNPLCKAAKLKPENFARDTFKKDEEWVQAERVAKRKMALFSSSLFALATYGLYRSEKARTAAAALARAAS